MEGAVPPSELLALIAGLERLAIELGREREELRRALRHVAQNQSKLDARLLPIEYSFLFRNLRAAGRLLHIWKTKVGRRLLDSPLHPLCLKLRGRVESGQAYQLWLRRENAALPSFEWHRERAARLVRQPLFSILMPVCRPQREWLEQAVQSVLDQSYVRWELCVCDDASGDDWVAGYFCTRSEADPRIRFIHSHEHAGISNALNRAGELASGEYCAFLDQDDTLSPYALHYVAETLEEGDVDLVYSDEDVTDAAGVRIRPVFKPGWSPDLLSCCMYLGHLLVVARPALERVGWLRSEFDGSQDYDLALRITGGLARVRHVPRILYHWRQHPGSTCGNPAAKPAAHAAGRHALEEAVAQRGWQAAVEDGPYPGRYAVRRKLPCEPKVSIVICSRKPRLLRRCLRHIESQNSYAQREIVVVRHRTRKNGSIDSLAAAFGCREVCYDGPFNFAEMNNRGARAAAGEILVFLNDDIEPLVPGWLASLVAQAVRPEVGADRRQAAVPFGRVATRGNRARYYGWGRASAARLLRIALLELGRYHAKC